MLNLLFIHDTASIAGMIRQNTVSINLILQLVINASSQ